MSTENTDQSQQPNPGEQAAAGTQSTEQQTAQATDAGKVEGQDGADKTGTENGDGQETKSEGAPESYTDFTLAEGFVLEGDRLAKATEFFRTNNWTQEQAQQAIDLYTSMVGEEMPGLTQAVQAQLESERIAQIERDGKETREALGAEYEATEALARTAVQALNDPELEEVFMTRGWGNNKSLVKAFAFFGKMMRSGASDTGGSTKQDSATVPLEDRMYGAAKT